ncbi:hypothetical protein H9P43_000184 [Blastocladiella emersonii ATCC 22665]|nr:hypothetical protein H9P43_000184 [Blastocladiella emersonii ATCC 22665]
MSSTKNPGARRIMREIAELEREGSDRYKVTLPGENIFELHFTIRGPADTPFADGLYHGILVLPSQYPYAPPEIFFWTPSGRFETRERICLSMTSFHSESWQPAWGIRTILIGLASFMATESDGSVGSIRWNADERLKLAKESLTWTCKDCGQSNAEILPITGAVRPLPDGGEVHELSFAYKKDEEAAKASSASAGASDPEAAAETRPPLSPASAPAAVARLSPSPVAARAPPSPRPVAEPVPVAVAREPTEHERKLATLDLAIVAVLVVIIAILARKFT